MYDSIKAKAFKEVRDADPEYIEAMIKLESIRDAEFSWFHETGKHMAYDHPDRKARMKEVMVQARICDDIQARIAIRMCYAFDELGVVGLANAGLRVGGQS